MRNIYILGAAGSIGLQTLEVIKEHPKTFDLIGISLGSNHKINHHILNNYSVQIVCLREKDMLDAYQKAFPNVDFVFGDEGLIAIATYPKKGLLVNALSGSAGLKPTVEAIKCQKDIALANKETLVMAGEIMLRLVDTYHVNLYPVDSEHSALWQLLRGEETSNVEKLVITASGGSLRNQSREQLKDVTVSQALKHPNWQMGAKITIDSATMMNKGLEVIEAHHLFHIPFENIETVIHHESVVHGLIYFIDGTIKASLSVSDMKIPISYALFYPQRIHYNQPLQLKNLSFSEMDFERFPLLKLAYEVGIQGGLMPTVMNAANEAAVKLFLDGNISFLEIEKIVFDTVAHFKNIKQPSIDDIIKTDQTIQLNIRQAHEKR